MPQIMETDVGQLHALQDAHVRHTQIRARDMTTGVWAEHEPVVLPIAASDKPLLTVGARWARSAAIVVGVSTV